ncbi:MAG: hypothetical protein Ta2D_12340 [Rickettsiales bacterium]|nr:MAG: hypothetical protein Ta2D_12340 [Rickettsiales bacterium]
MLLLFFVIFSFSARADNDKTKITADRLKKENDSVIAIGDVHITQKGYTIKADKVEYDTKNKEIKTDELINVHSTKPEQIFFAEGGSVKEDLTEAEFNNGILVLKNGSVFRGKKILKEDNVDTLKRGRYSVCPTKIFDKDLEYDDVKEKTIKDFILTGSTINYDETTKQVELWNGVIWFYGIPMFYAPYLYGNIESDKKNSGFEMIGIEKHSNFGYGIRIPYTIRDENYKLKFTQKIWQYKGERNYLFNINLTTSNIHYNMDLVNDNGRSKTFKVSEFGGTEEKANIYNKYRGYVESNGDFKLNKMWDFAYNGRIISDRYYMRDYHGGQVDYTENNATFEKADNENLEDYTFFRLNNIFYQEMNKNLKEITPNYMPMMDYNIESKYLKMSFNSMNMYRNSATKDNYNRATFVPEVRYIKDTPIGMIHTHSTITTNIYDEEQNFTPQFNIEWSKNIIVSQILLKPIVKYSHSKIQEDRKIKKNEDTNPYSLSFTNIFTDNRLIGYDRMEHGRRLSYGFEGIVFEHLTFGIAQTYSPDIKEQLKEEKLELTGFNEENDYSDYVGFAGLRFNRYFDLYYKFTADQETLEQTRKEAILSMGYKIFSFNTSYLMEKKPNRTREQMTMSASIKLSDTFTLTGSTTKDMVYDQFVQSQAILTYDNNCYIWTLNYTDDNPLNKLQRNRSFGFNFVLKLF